MGLSIVELKEGVITKVATNILGGSVKNLSLDKEIFCTTRATGAEAPTGSEFANEAHNLFVRDPVEDDIDCSYAIDVYMMAPSGEAKIKVETP